MMIDKIICGVERLAKDKEVQIDNFQFLVDSPEKEMGLYGSGMLIINTPWQVKEKVEQSLKVLTNLL
jgi:23S rRNA A2030 N6-methylase RlmJ